MKEVCFVFTIMMALSLNSACTGQSEKSDKQPVISEAGNVEVVYFHNARRCVTCKAVESVSGDVIADMYGADVPFSVYDLEEAEGKSRAQELGVSGQALVIVKGDKKTDITSEGFMYARNNPEKLRAVIAENIGSLR
jgi:hypothetical protein